MRLRLKPSQASWDSLNAILAEQARLCGWVLDKVDVPGSAGGDRPGEGHQPEAAGPQIKPFVVPAGVRDSLKVAAQVLTFETRTNTLRIDPDAIWYSADVAVKSR